MKTTLVVMAAGMGSRFGGLKQAASITEDGRGILDFSIYDAKKAGFDRVIFILRKDIEEDFRRLIGKRIENEIEVKYVIQDTSVLPEGRTKPFGTGHAVLCCKDYIDGPFCIINADDYYGRNAYKLIHDHLVNSKNGEYCMLAYQLDHTYSENGTVNRGVCNIKDGYLLGIEEACGIDNKGRYKRGEEEIQLVSNTPVSMNIWGLTPDIFTILEKEYQSFLKKADLLKDEIYIQLVIFKAIQEGLCKVKVYPNADIWCGITYKEDLPQVQNTLRSYIEKGYYQGI